VKKTTFFKLKTIKDMSNSKTLKEGDMFLHGESMINQLKKKETGNEISYYRVTKVKKGGRISYQPVFDILED
jgi:hypothetical protein